MRLGDKLRHIMDIRGISQLDLSEKAGVSLTVIKGLLSGRQKTTTIDTAQKLAATLKIPPSYFVDDKIVTPFEVLDHIPQHIQSFILNQENMDYLELAVDLKGKKLPPHVAKKVIENYEEAIRLLSDTKKDTR